MEEPSRESFLTEYVTCCYYDRKIADTKAMGV